MKILSTKRDGDRIIITTDNEPRPEFVYFFQQFKDGDAILAEMEKSIGAEAKRKKDKDDSFDKIDVKLKSKDD